MRLRPNGASGLLVSSLDAYRSYQLEDAWTWEHQALIRARAVAGDPEVSKRFAEIRREVLARPRDPDKLRRDVCEMRERMRAELQRGGADQFDLKQGPGGIADIEFMVQYAVLRWAHEYPDLLEFSDNIRLLDGLERHGLLAAEEAGGLRDAYRAFRASYHRNALQELPGLVAGRRHADERARVSGLWRRLMHAPAGAD
jgi:glutamate-ammonia-ligase adenylyltransferase